MRRTKPSSATRRALLDRKERLEKLVAEPRAEDPRAEEPQERCFHELRAAEARELLEVDAALERLDLGTYGRCERCGGAIGALRLHAMPSARLCVSCINEKAA